MTTARHGAAIRISLSRCAIDVILPLPVTAFEYYYLADDRAEYPPIFPVRLVLSGALDRSALDIALQMSIARHPLLTARIDTSGRWPVWVAGDAPQVVELASGEAPTVDRLGLARCAAGGLRVFVDTAAEQSIVWLVFHHACSDGLAALLFAEELLLAYAHVVDGKSGEPPWRELDATSLARRDEFGLAGYQPTVMDGVNTVRAWWPLVSHRAAVVASARTAANGDSGQSVSFHTEWLRREQSALLVEIAHELGVTVNDLLLRDLLLTLADWNRDHGLKRGRLRILVPTNLRQKEDWSMPAANVLSFAFVTRKPKQMRDRTALLRSIQRQTTAIKRWRIGLYFVGGLEIACKSRGIVDWFLRRQWSFATAVFSNVGPVFSQWPHAQDDGRAQCGGLRLEGISGTAPLRRGTRLAVVALTYAGRLGLFVRCDPAWFTSAERDQLADALMERIQQTLQSRT